MTIQEKEELVKKYIDGRKDIRGVYCIYDRLAKEMCSPIFHMSNDEAAKRSYAEVIGHKENYPDPNDYSLIRLGYIDRASALLVDSEQEILVTGKPVVQEVNQ